MDESRRVLHACCIGGRVGTVERQMEVEIGEFLLQTEEIFEVEDLVQRTRTVEIVHFAVGRVQRFRHMHNLGTQRSHSCASADPNHLLFRVEMRMEVAKRTAHRHFVAGFQRENIRRGNARIHLHETALVGLHRRRGNTNRQHENVALGGIVRHRIGANRGFGILALQREQAEFLPRRQIFFANQRLVEILVVVDAVEGRNLDLRIRTRNEVHVFAGRQLYFEFLDERGDIPIGNDGTFVLLHAENRLIDVDFQVALHLALATQSPACLNLLAAEMGLFRVENLAATLQDLHLALAARGFSAASRRQEHAVFVERRHHRRALRNVDDAVAVNLDIHVSARRKIFFRHEQNGYKQKYCN